MNLNIEDRMEKAHQTALRLGASLYVPCTRSDLGEIAAGKIVGLRSVIFCLEDAVRDDELEGALGNLAEMLESVQPSKSLLRFIRVRDVAVAEKVLGFRGVEKIDGFVLPKVDGSCVKDYVECFSGNGQWLMPTLETANVFDSWKMARLRDMVLEAGWGSKVLSWRVGGNDLMNLLGVRRSRVRCIYESPLAPALASLVATFKPHGFNLTAPVCELLDHRELLNTEVPRDLEFGFFGKTAIHPDQVSLIEAHYRVFADDLGAAQRILAEDAPAVFRCGGAMCEPKTHERWARSIVERSKIYGVVGS